MMNKPLLLLMCPCTTMSGYGARSRDIATALINSDKYRVIIYPTRWGNTPQNALDPINPTHKAILDRFVTGQLPTQPDIFIQITVPNEFQKVGKYNIGITAGIETDLASGEWIEGCNRMDLVLTSSEHAKKVLENSTWQKNTEKGENVGEIKCTTPIKVLFEGVDLVRYTQDVQKDARKTIDQELSMIKESFAFLFVGHWLNGDIGQDRKDVGMLCKVFLEAFKKKAPQNQPALILKTSRGDFSPVDKLGIISRLEQIYDATQGHNLPNIYLLHGDLTDDEMNALYNHPKIKAHVTFTKGEGFGRPLAEASISAKPIIAPNYSGHLDFLQHAVLLQGTMNPVHPSSVWDKVILRESKWFTVDYGAAGRAMIDVVENYKNYEITAKKQATLIRKEFSFDAMSEKLLNILDEHAPKQVALKLPQLKKIELPKLQKV